MIDWSGFDSLLCEFFCSIIFDIACMQRFAVAKHPKTYGLAHYFFRIGWSQTAALTLIDFHTKVLDANKRLLFRLNHIHLLFAFKTQFKA